MNPDEMPPVPALDDLRRRRPRPCGDLLTVIFQDQLDLCGDETLASVATAAVLNDLLTEADRASLETP